MSKKQSFINEITNLMNSVDYKWASDEAKAYWEFRELFRDMKNALREYSEEWGHIVNHYFMPKCEFFGYCNERKPCKKKFQKETKKNED